MVGYCNGESRVAPAHAGRANGQSQTRRTATLHSPGMLAMAKTSNPNTGGSQFYIVPTGSSPSHLDGYTLYSEGSDGCHTLMQSIMSTGIMMMRAQVGTNSDDVRLISARVM